MTLTNTELENLELKYLEKINSLLVGHQEKMIKNLESMNNILEYWEDKPHDDGYDSGAERVIYSILQTGSDLGDPNSCPVASDLFFENPEAFIHIDLKSAQPDNNLSDHWRVPVGKNQTSYAYNIKPQGSLKERPFNPSIPKYYNDKPSLTYFITILYSRVDKNFKVVNINVSCMPNGQLTDIYKYDTLSPGKNPHDDKARFTTNECYLFKTLNDPNKKRVKVNYINQSAIQNDFRQRFEKFLSSIKFS